MKRDRKDHPLRSPINGAYLSDDSQIQHQLRDAPNSCFADDIRVRIIDVDDSGDGLSEVFICRVMP